MSNLKRTVKNGRSFDMGTKHAARVLPRGGYTPCSYCRKEKASVYDHIDPLENGGLSNLSNCAHICGRCHFDKTRKERKIMDLANVATMSLEMALHAERYAHKVFRANGERRVPNPDTVLKYIKIIRKIEEYDHKVRQARNSFQRDHFLKLKARWRRELRGKINW